MRILTTSALVANSNGVAAAAVIQPHAADQCAPENYGTFFDVTSNGETYRGTSDLRCQMYGQTYRGRLYDADESTCCFLIFRDQTGSTCCFPRLNLNMVKGPDTFRYYTPKEMSRISRNIDACKKRTEEEKRDGKWVSVGGSVLLLVGKDNENDTKCHFALAFTGPWHKLGAILEDEDEATIVTLDNQETYAMQYSRPIGAQDFDRIETYDNFTLPQKQLTKLAEIMMAIKIPEADSSQNLKTLLIRLEKADFSEDWTPLLVLLRSLINRVRGGAALTIKHAQLLAEAKANHLQSTEKINEKIDDIFSRLVNLCNNGPESEP